MESRYVLLYCFVCGLLERSLVIEPVVKECLCRNDCKSVALDDFLARKIKP